MDLENSFNIVSSQWAGQPQWLLESRRKAQEQFFLCGWPTQKLENYKYTSFKDTSHRNPYIFQEKESVGAIKANNFTDLDQEFTANNGAFCLIFVDGVFVPAKSSYPKDHVQILRSDREESLAWLKTTPEHIGKMAEDPLHLLRKAFFTFGYYIYVQPDQVLERPLHVVSIWTKQESEESGLPSLMAQNLIRMGAGSKAQILESYLGLGGTPYFYNGYTQILCEENSHLEFVRVSQHGENSVADHGLVAECGSDSSLSHFELSLGEGLVRNEVQISLTDQGCDLSSYGAYLVGGRAHVDNHTYIAHLAPNSQSRQLYKGIVQDQGRAVFDGRVFIERGADGTNASQLNRNLLLSDLAEVDAKPNLEIYADDVKATHGATIGRLSDEEMFYLQSRGIDKAQAKKILCQGFIEDVVYKIKSEVIRELVAQILKPIVHKMEGSWQ